MYLNLFIFLLIFPFYQNSEKIFENIELPTILNLIFKFGKIDDNSRLKCLKNNSTLYERYYDVVESTGKRPGEFGNRDLCIRNKEKGLTYFLFIFDISKSLNETINLIRQNYKIKNYKIKISIQIFLNNTKYVIGACLFIECIEAASNFLILNSNYIDNFFGSFLGEIKIFFDNNFYKSNKILSQNSSLVHPPKIKQYESNFNAIKLNILIFIAISILCTLIKVFFFFTDNNENIEDLIKINLDDSDEGYYEEDEDENENKNVPKIFNEENEKKNNFYTKETKINKFLSIFDIFYNIRIFFLYKNQYFDGSNIEIIGFIRMMIMIGIIFEKNFLIAIKTFLQIDILNFEIFKSLKFILVKLSCFNNIIWIILDGAIFGFKLLSYHKNYKEKEKINQFIFFEFLIYLIPNILIFLFTYYFFYIYGTNFADNIYYDYYMITLNDIKCYNYNLMIFNPLNFYKNDFSCFSFTYIFVNEFYCMLILFMIVYISKKLQNYSFDLIISFIILIQLVTVQISVSSKIVDNIPIVLNMFLGENHMEKQLHLFLSIFYLGFLVGIFFFYYHNPVYSNSNSNSLFREFYPFSFINNLVEKINNYEIKIHLLVCTGLSFVLLFIAFIPLFFKDYFGEIGKFQIKKNGIENTLDANNILKFIKYIIFYEKSVYALCFSIFLIFFKILSDKTFIASALQNEFINSFEKIRVIFFCIIEFLMNYFYTIFLFNYTFSYNNLVYLSYGLFLIIYFINFLIYVLFIMPLIKFVKAITQSNKNKTIFDYNNSIASKKELTDYTKFN